MSKAWKPLGDGQYDSQHRINTIIVEGEWLKISELTLPMREIVEAELALPHDIRLCQLVDVDTPQPMPDEVRATMLNALELLREDDNFYLAGRHEDEINAAFTWLDGLAKE